MKTKNSLLLAAVVTTAFILAPTIQASDVAHSPKGQTQQRVLMNREAKTTPADGDLVRAVRDLGGSPKGRDMIARKASGTTPDRDLVGGRGYTPGKHPAAIQFEVAPLK